VNDAPLDLLVLHALRLKGFAAPSAVAAFAGSDPAASGEALERLAGAGLVKHRASAGWSLTPEGRTVGERLLHEELDRAGAGADVTARYQEFRILNPEFLQLCTDWQVVDVDQQRLNRHDDPVYDQLIIKRLGKLDEQVQPICRSLVDRLDRFGRYGPGFDHAVQQVRGGAIDWLTGATIESYHTLWFELHEDLLATLGRTREQERESEPESNRPLAEQPESHHA
jgi:hypothetical protein